MEEILKRVNGVDFPEELQQLIDETEDKVILRHVPKSEWEVARAALSTTIQEVARFYFTTLLAEIAKEVKQR